jgi:hypothetical protein
VIGFLVRGSVFTEVHRTFSNQADAAKKPAQPASKQQHKAVDVKRM